jgi:PAS domain-containing protein
MSYVPDKDEQGRTLGYVALIHDMTDRHRAELALQAERKRLHDILMNAPAAISLRSGPDGVFTFVNAKYQSIMRVAAMLGGRRASPPGATSGSLRRADRARVRDGEAVTGTEVPR